MKIRAPEPDPWKVGYPCLWIALVFLATVAATGSGESPAGEVLIVDERLEREIAGGEEHDYWVDSMPGERWRIAVDQRGIDLVIRVSDAAGDELVSVDAPFGRQGQERVIVEAPEGGFFGIRLAPSSPSARAGSYEILATRLPPAPAGSRADRLLAAELAMTVAGARSLRGGKGDRRQAMQRYREAAAAFRELGKVRDEALALYAAGGLALDAGDPDSAMRDQERALQLWQSLGDANFEAVTLNDLGLAHLNRDEGQEAASLFMASASIQRRIGNAYGEAVSRNNLCLHALHLGDPRDAVPCFERVAALFAKSRERWLAAGVLLNLGGAHDTLGEPLRSVTLYEEALEEYRALGDRLGEAQALHNLGMALKRRGRLQPAMEHLRDALQVFEETGYRRWQARAASNLGDALALLGDLPRAVSFYGRALETRHQVGDTRGEAITLGRLAEARRRQDRLPEALELHRRSLDLLRRAGDSWREAMALAQVAQVQAELGELARARATFDLALRRHQELGDRKSEAQTLLLRGRVAFELSDLSAAEADFRHALGLHEALRWLSATAECHFELARLARRRGRTEEALRAVRDGLRAAESLRDRVEVPSLQASFIASVNGAYQLEVDLLLALGAPEEAFQTSERGRARALLRLLSAAEVDVHPHLTEQHKARRRGALDRLNAKAQRRLDFLAGRHSAERLAAATRELDEALVELELLEAEARRQEPDSRPDSLATLDLDTARRLIDDETLLLEYLLGEERSHLFAVGSSGLSTFELPRRAAIKALVRQAVGEMQTLVAGSASSSSGADRELGELLLGPLAEALGAKRLIIVADGALHHLPFEALPLPGGLAGERVISRHEVVYVPSVSVLALKHRRNAEHRASGLKKVVVLADPVYRADDPRLTGRRRASSAERLNLTATLLESLGGFRAGAGSAAEFERLPGTSREARAIAALLPPDQVMVRTGFQANRQALTTPGLREARILHLAAHGVTDQERPAMSGLALSMLDRRGRRQDGFLRLHDLSRLELDADLVVLSGCETAMGQRLAGEGLMGLTYGFFHAGARQVIASRWRVRDRVTAVFMAELYRQLLVEGKEPAAALRQAQRFVAARREWRHPYYWASFGVYGWGGEAPSENSRMHPRCDKWF